jgi:hypothetical protein
MRIASFLGLSSLGVASQFSPRLFAAGTFAAIIIAAGLGSGRVAFAESTSTPAATTPAPARQPIAAVRPDEVKPAEYHLVYKFLLNQDVHMPLSVDSHIQVQKDQAITNTMNQSTVERHYHVDSVEPDGSAIVELFIDNVKLTYAFNNGNPITYDTSKKDLPPRGFEGVNRSLGMHGRVRFSPRGNVLPLAGLPNDPVTDPSESFLDPLPSKPIHVGEEWFEDFKVKVSVSRSLNQRITLRRRYTLESVDGKVATIRLRTSEITPVDDAQIRAQLVQRTPEGKITFDLDRGVTVSRDLTCSRTETGVMGEGSQIAATTHWKGCLR